ncbi:hypothetical protein JCM19233_1348 [Vibrio astriarenae]|nr:hypothetical protein JCM19233_1348 [Vibrio sp. C7]
MRSSPFGGRLIIFATFLIALVLQTLLGLEASMFFVLHGYYS